MVKRKIWMILAVLVMAVVFGIVGSKEIMAVDEPVGVCHVDDVNDKTTASGVCSESGGMVSSEFTKDFLRTRCNTYNTSNKYYIATCGPDLYGTNTRCVCVLETSKRPPTEDGNGIVTDPGEGVPSYENNTPGYDPSCTTDSGGMGTSTALGCIPVETKSFVTWLLKYLFGIAGGIAFLLMAYGFILIATSGGDEKKVAGAKETITSAIVGLLVCIFSIFILKLIAVNILQIPGF